MKNQNIKLVQLFDKLKLENAQSGIGRFPNGKSFVGRIVKNEETYMTLIGYKGKRIKIYSFQK